MRQRLRLSFYGSIIYRLLLCAWPRIWYWPACCLCRLEWQYMQASGRGGRGMTCNIMLQASWIIWMVNTSSGIAKVASTALQRRSEHMEVYKSPALHSCWSSGMYPRRTQGPLSSPCRPCTIFFHIWLISCISFIHIALFALSVHDLRRSAASKHLSMRSLNFTARHQNMDNGQAYAPIELSARHSSPNREAEPPSHSPELEDRSWKEHDMEQGPRFSAVPSYHTNAESSNSRTQDGVMPQEHGTWSSFRSKMSG